ncbi:MAG: pyruvate kinase alpha/beta domain-containing protein, partial [Anaerovorax sp.]
RNKSITNAIGYATCTSAYGFKARAILTPTSSGHTATVVAKFRPKAPILAFTMTERIARSLSLVWGTYPLVIRSKDTPEEVHRMAVEVAMSHELIKAGDVIIITAGVPVGVKGNTNMMRIHVVGNSF